MHLSSFFVKFIAICKDKPKVKFEQQIRYFYSAKNICLEIDIFIAKKCFYWSNVCVGW